MRRVLADGGRGWVVEREGAAYPVVGKRESEADGSRKRRGKRRQPVRGLSGARRTEAEDRGERTRRMRGVEHTLH